MKQKNIRNAKSFAVQSKRKGEKKTHLQSLAQVKYSKRNNYKVIQLYLVSVISQASRMTINPRVYFFFVLILCGLFRIALQQLSTLCNPVAACVSLFFLIYSGLKRPNAGSHSAKFNPLTPLKPSSVLTFRLGALQLPLNYFVL